MSTVRLIVALIAGAVFGWAMAHKAVATDCQRLGAFYDGTHVHQCAVTQDHSLKG